MPINRIFFKDANDFSAKQPMRPFPLEFAFIHESFINLDFVPRLWQFTNSWVKAIPLENSRIVLSGFSPIFPPVVDGGRRGGGRGRVVVKVGYSVSSFCPQFHLPRSRFPFVTVPRLPANWLTAKENAITRERFMKNEPRRLKRRFMELWRAATFFSNIQFNLKQRTATRYFSLMFRWDICWLCTKCDGWGKKFAYFETSFFFLCILK